MIEPPENRITIAQKEERALTMMLACRKFGKLFGFNLVFLIAFRWYSSYIGELNIFIEVLSAVCASLSICVVGYAIYYWYRYKKEMMEILILKGEHLKRRK